MEMKLNFNAKEGTPAQLAVISGFCKKVEKKGKKGDENQLVNSHWPKDFKEAFSLLKNNETFKGSKGDSFYFSLNDGTTVLALGLGDKSKFTNEALRRDMAKLFKAVKNKYEEIAINMDHFLVKGNLETTTFVIKEAFGLTSYFYDKHLTKKNTCKLSKITLDSKSPKTKEKKAKESLIKAGMVTESVNFARDLVNDPPNFLNSVSYAKIVEADAKKLKRVKCKVLGKPEIKKEKMGMFLSVNAGSAHEPRLVHLTYTPKKVTKNTKHICLVGKGLTFDTGGYSLKPGGSMANMKFDMAGSSTVYGAFRAAALMDADVIITCLLGMTDNAVNEKATMPDSIVTARNGKTVEILNTDAEGRLVLGDVLSYACDLKPNAIIDSATLTGAVLVALGTEVCGLMGNNKKLADDLLKAAKATDEQMWELPIIDPWREDMKSPIADLKNIGGTRFAGSAKAAAFLENFIEGDIPWAHLDIAGIGDSQGYLPYCPAKGASGSIIRTLTHYLMTTK